MRKAVLAGGVLGTTILMAATALVLRRRPVGNKSVPEPAKPVDVKRYMGRWYEQFRYEAWFEKDLDAVTADYGLNDDGTVTVVNRGRKGGPGGRIKQSIGNAKIEDTATNAKLKVAFVRPFYGDYWVLDHGDEYQWSIVGEPSGRYLWILTRETNPNPDLLEQLKNRAQEMGYDLSSLRNTQH
ncbi:lipocalin family protein [Altererythrobacter sp. Root672]|uniref:lipocalin family protein n=1 Tax=Altererythrobacter sp. Root672 TaxID=1736584 RepID=UPI0006F749EB|nr:lipocalin family protein [Altererythrobacter sp. Root672]KRA83649.1 lipocalin [Altererythrobacter sp. Root672]